MPTIKVKDTVRPRSGNDEEDDKQAQNFHLQLLQVGCGGSTGGGGAQGEGWAKGRGGGSLTLFVKTKLPQHRSPTNTRHRPNVG